MRFHKPYFRLLAGLLCLLLTLGGCQDPQPDSVPGADSLPADWAATADSGALDESPGQDASRTPVSGGTLRMAICMPQTLNPLKASQPEVAQLLMILFMPLLETDAQGLPSSDGVVSAWEVSRDGYEVTLTVRGDIRWHDGSLLTAGDAAYSLQALASAETDHYWKSGLRDFVSAEADEQGRVKVTFANPVDEKRLGALTVPVLPRHIYDTDEPPEWTPVGCGPYQVENYQPMREIILRANPDYIGGDPYIPEITIDITRSEDAVQTAFEQGLTQLLYERVPTGMSAENIYHHVVHQTETYQLQMLYMNQRPGRPLSDVSVRRAVMYCIDAQELIDRTQVHQGTVSESVVPLWLADNGLQETYGVDYQKAYSLLGEYKMSELRLIVSRDEQTARAQAWLIYEQLSEIGLKVKIALLDRAQWEEALREGDFDLAFGSSRIGAAQDLYNLLYSGSEGNYSGIENAELDRLLDQLSASAERSAAYQSLARYAWENLPVCPLYYSKQAVVVSRRLGGELAPSPYHMYKGIEKLYFFTDSENDSGGIGA